MITVLDNRKRFSLRFWGFAAWRLAEEEEQEIPDEPMTMQNDLHEEKSEEVTMFEQAWDCTDITPASIAKAAEAAADAAAAAVEASETAAAAVALAEAAIQEAAQAADDAATAAARAARESAELAEGAAEAAEAAEEAAAAYRERHATW